MDNGPIRVATFNIRGGAGRDGGVDLARTAETLMARHPSSVGGDRSAAATKDGTVDFAALQEVRAGWWQETDQAELLARKLGMQSLFVPVERRWWRDHFGNGVVTRLSLGPIHRIPLPCTEGKGYRAAVLTSFRHRGRTIHVLAVHIARGRDRVAQLETICDLFLSLEEPAILLGDLNTTSDDPQLATLVNDPSVTAVVGAEGQDGPAAGGVDWIIARGLVCTRRETRDVGASDHPAVHAELDLP